MLFVDILKKHIQTAAVLLFAITAMPHAMAQETSVVDAATLKRLYQPIRPILPNQGQSTQRINHTLHGKTDAAAQQGAGTTLKVTRFDFIGNASISTEDLRAALAPFIGDKVSVRDLALAAQTATDIYAARGYNVARVVMPPQDIVGGVVQLLALEGYLQDGTIEISDLTQGEADLNRIQAILDGHIDVDSPIRRQTYERALRIVDALPGVAIHSYIYPGREPGNARLLVELHRTQQITSAIIADNYGVHASGAHRLSAYSIFENLTDNFESIEIDIASSGAGNYFVSTQAHLPLGTDGWVVGGVADYLRYNEIGNFDAGGEHGYAWSTTLTASYPLVLLADYSLHATFGSGYNALVDKSDTNGRESRNVMHAEAALSGEKVWTGDKTAITGFRASLSAGDVNVETGNDTRGTSGGFAVAGLRLTHLQTLGNGFSTYHAAHAQAATQNLNGLFKCSVGGPGSNRAYPVGEVAADHCAVFNNELLYDVKPVFAGASWQLGVFAEAARTWENARKTSGIEHYVDTLFGTGVSTEAHWGTWGALRLAIARQFTETEERKSVGQDADHNSGDYRGWIQFSLHF